MKSCRKCGKHIPNYFKINGKACNLQNRKFCLDCSPYNGRNTKIDDPSRPTKRGEKYSRWSDERKRMSMLSTYKRGYLRKQELVEKAGGKCKVCDYNRTIDALIFHHRNEKEKLFGLSLNNLWSKSMEEIMSEFVKCDLLCSNCHIELHRKRIDSDETTYRNLLK